MGIAPNVFAFQDSLGRSASVNFQPTATSGGRLNDIANLITGTGETINKIVNTFKSRPRTRETGGVGPEPLPVRARAAAAPAINLTTALLVGGALLLLFALFGMRK